MGHLQKVNFGQLDSTQVAEYQPFLVPAAEAMIRRRTEYPLIFGVESRKHGRLIGFALVVCEQSIKTARLASLFVQEGSRGKRLGLALLAFAEKELIQKKCLAICAEFADDNPFKEAFEKILLEQGWNKPYVYMVCCYYEVQRFHPPWFMQISEIPETFQSFLWSTLKPQERQHLLFQSEQGTFPASVSPFIEEETIEYCNSLGLRYQNQVVGWIVTHRHDAETVVYSSLYIHPEYRHTGHAIRLLAKSIRMQQETSIPMSLFRVNLETINHSWLQFVKIRLMPYAQKIQRIKWGWHSLYDPF